MNIYLGKHIVYGDECKVWQFFNCIRIAWSIDRFRLIIDIRKPLC